MARKPLTPDRVYRRARTALIFGMAVVTSGFAIRLSGHRAGDLFLIPAAALMIFTGWHIGWLNGFRAARTGQ